MNRAERKRQALMNEARKLKGMGFRVWITREGSGYHYGHFSDGERVAYFQIDSFNESVKFSSVHKPGRRWGTGFGDMRTPQDALFCLAPLWASSGASFDVKKYRPEEIIPKVIEAKHHNYEEVL